MIDHVAIDAGDYERSKAVFAEAPGPPGYELGMEGDGKALGFAAPGKPDLRPYRGTAAAQRTSRSPPPTGRRSTHSRFSPGRRRNGQRAAGATAEVPRELLRRLRPRSGREQTSRRSATRLRRQVAPTSSGSVEAD